MAEVRERLHPPPRVQGVMGEALHMLVEMAGVEAFDGLEDAHVEDLAVFVEEAAVGHLVG